jgi:hypothetical protein
MGNRFYTVGISGIALACLASLATAAKLPISYDAASGRVMVKSGRLQLRIDTSRGINPCSLIDTKTTRVYADTDYAWSGGITFKRIGKPTITKVSATDTAVSILGKSDSLMIILTYRVKSNEPDSIVESIRITNSGNEPLDTSSFACGFSKLTGTNREDINDTRFCNVPYRVHTETGELCDYSIADLTTKKNWFSTARSAIYNRIETDLWGAEAWAWYQGANTLLISKYNSNDMEWSLLAPPTADEPSLRFGGVGRWKLGDPQGAALLAPEASFRFGETRYQIVDGDWKEAYAAYRKQMDQRGHVVPANYNPLIYWNELYNNQLWWVGDSVENRAKYYNRSDMVVEADLAKEMGCEALYLDPGWDTTFGSNIWDAKRLGPQAEFVQWLKDKYGFVLALHTPLAPWTDATEYPVEARRMDKAGNRMGELCTSSSVYIKTKVDRLKELCQNGATFLMYDGSWFPGECWDPTHGHSLPVTHKEHLDAILKLAQQLHEAYPKVIIEQHDPMLGPGTPRYVPTYFMHDKPGAFNELWGYEFMVEPMDDIVSRRAISLYYYNLAYNIPIYLHIDLRKDNANALMLWWYMSTCRHLGVGGKSADPAIWEAQKQAMKDYKENRAFFAQGDFYGLDETVHVHTLASKGEAAINCFNLTDEPETRDVKFELAQIGLKAKPIAATGAELTQKGGFVSLKITIPAKAHRLVKLSYR